MGGFDAHHISALPDHGRHTPVPGRTMMEVAVTAIAKGQRITGADRVALAEKLKKRYESGASIRELAADTSRSYGFIHRILVDAGVKLRGRGGATRGKAVSGGAAKQSGGKKAK
jgi:hypothetical protein